MKLPSTTFRRRACGSRSMPSPPLPETRLPQAGLRRRRWCCPAPPAIFTPSRPLGTRSGPLAFVPTRLPMTRLPEVPAPSQRDAVIDVPRDEVAAVGLLGSAFRPPIVLSARAVAEEDAVAVGAGRVGAPPRQGRPCRCRGRSCRRRCADPVARRYVGRGSRRARRPSDRLPETRLPPPTVLAVAPWSSRTPLPVLGSIGPEVVGSRPLGRRPIPAAFGADEIAEDEFARHRRRRSAAGRSVALPGDQVAGRQGEGRGVRAADGVARQAADAVRAAEHRDASAGVAEHRRARRVRADEVARDEVARADRRDVPDPSVESSSRTPSPPLPETRLPARRTPDWRLTFAGRFDCPRPRLAEHAAERVAQAAECRRGPCRRSCRATTLADVPAPPSRITPLPAVAGDRGCRPSRVPRRGVDAADRVRPGAVERDDTADGGQAGVEPTPFSALPIAPVPSAFVPMKLPETRLPEAPSSSSMPSLALPEIRLPAPLAGAADGVARAARSSSTPSSGWRSPACRRRSCRSGCPARGCLTPRPEDEHAVPARCR